MSLAWVGVGVAAFGAISAADSSRSAGNRQQDALNQQTAQAKSADQIAQDQLNFNKQVYADGSSARTDAQKNSNDIAAAQLQGMQFATDQAKSDKAYNEGTFRPLETGLVNDAQNYDTTQRRETAAQSAQADVDQSFNLKTAATRARRGPAVGLAGRIGRRFCGRCRPPAWPTGRAWATAPQR
ncbi:MAG TPA: hypothetical protein VIM34_18060, partial [Burkholderiaceae bacterium]